MEKLIQELLQDLNKKIDDEVDLMFEMVPEELKDILTYYHKQGGKRYRPLLMYLSCGMSGGNPEQTLPVATSYELLHTFSLYHDDVIDHAETRRGAPSVMLRWGKETAIIAGDIMHALIHAHILQGVKRGYYSSDIAIELFKEVVYNAELPTGWATLKEMELALSDKTPSIEEVIWITETKTAPIIEVSAWSGGLIGGASEEQLNGLRKFGKNLGLAYQLIDDILDLVGTANQDKPRGGDLKENKKTLIYVLVEQRRPGTMQKYVGKELSSEDIDQFIKENADVLNEVKKKALFHFEEARRSLNVFPDTKYKRIMLSLLENIANRKY